MAYTLTLTAGERKAFDWVGNRYSHGHDLSKLIMKGQWERNDGWGWLGEGDIRFTIPEHIAWEIRDMAEEGDYLWDCFAPELAAKMTDFCMNIV